MKRHLLVPTYIFTCILLLAGLFVIPASAQGGQPPTDDEVNAVAKELFCPVCENTPLDVCPTQACRQWRDQIRSMLAEGRTSDEIKQYFVDTYGDRVLNEPPLTGLNWLAYLVPPLAILAGTVYLVRSLRGMKKPATPVLSRVEGKSPASGADRSESPRPADDDYVARFEEEVRKRK